MPTVLLAVYASIEQCDIMQGALTSFSIAAQANPNRQVKAESEADKETVGVLGKVASGLETIGGIVQTAVGIAGTVAGIAMMVGLSKPTISNNVTVVQPGVARYMANCDCVDVSQTGALFSDAKSIAPPDIFSSEIDPMQINQITSRVGFLRYVDYTTTTVEDAILWKANCVPGLYSFWLAPPKAFPTPLTFVAAHFKYWRGTITYRFSLVKTTYHTGTLEISIDYGKSTIEPSSDQRSATLHRVLWDITLQDELTVDVPYVWPVHFREFFHQICDDSGILYNGPAIFIKAITPLGATTSVGSGIEILIEHWSEDMQFAWPHYALADTASTFEGLSFGPSKGKEKERKTKQNEKIVPQMFKFGGSSSSVAGAFDPGTRTHELRKRVLLGPSPTKSDPGIMAGRFLGGENIPNLRLVTRRFYYSKSYSTVVSNTYTEIVNFNDKDSMPDYLWSLSRLFVFGFGGFRAKLIPQPVEATGGVSRAIVSVGKIAEVNVAEPNILFGNVQGVEITIPNMSPFPYYQLINVARTPMKLYAAPAFEKYDVWLSLADDHSWGGMNYLSSYTFLASGNPPLDVAPGFIG
jgi:hypothetical protein